MKCIITLAATNRIASARHELIPIQTISLDWEEIPEEIKKFIKSTLEKQWRNIIENTSKD